VATLIASLAAVAVACVPSAAAAAQTAVAGPTVLDPMSALEEPGAAVVLSDEKLVTRWGHANETYPIRIAARTGARTITRLRFDTEDKYPEVYLVLDGKLDEQGVSWLHIRIPMRPNGRTGWVPAEMLSQLYVVRTQLVIDRTAKRAKLYKNGRRIWEAPVGIGKAGTPTPRGAFWVRERLKGFGGSYGPWAFGTSAYSSISDWPNGGVVGIHGTNEPGLIPGRPSHGCVRVRNNKISQLSRLMPIGTPVRIVH
jgi:lipoprotein-anchoring transpeptidase ErfK/SrfK